MGNGLEAGQAGGRETSYVATAVILKRSDEGLNQSSNGGSGLDRSGQIPMRLRKTVFTGLGDQ